MAEKMTLTDKEWWFPELTDDAWVARIRADYPEETSDLDDEAIRDKYADGYKYADQWDHLGDAREEYEKLADAYLELLRNHLTQPAQAVDDALVEAATEAYDSKLLETYPDSSFHKLGEGDKAIVSECMRAALTRVLGNAQAEGWKDIATAPRGSRKVIVLVSNAGPNGYITDPWTGWIESDGTAARWPHEFPPTHWMPLPTPPSPRNDDDSSRTENRN